MADKSPLVGKLGVLVAAVGTLEEILQKEADLIRAGYRQVGSPPLDTRQYCREPYFDGELWRYSLQWMEPGQQH